MPISQVSSWMNFHKLNTPVLPVLRLKQKQNISCPQKPHSLTLGVTRILIPTPLMSFPCFCTFYKGNHTVCSLLCQLLSHRVMSVRFIHIAACSYRWFILFAGGYSIVWIHYNLFIRSTVDGRLGSFQSGAIIKSQLHEFLHSAQDACSFEWMLHGGF